MQSNNSKYTQEIRERSAKYILESGISLQQQLHRKFCECEKGALLKAGICYNGEGREHFTIDCSSAVGENNK